ncbi:MAG: calcium/sodium antiporter [Patescibacteria group bacterium]
MLIAILLLLVGLGVLILGAEILVRGSASLAKKLGISSLVIGLTVVAFGTSAPELFVNIYSASRGGADIAIGNIVGSNISNILLILGISALVRPLKVGRGTAFREIPFALLAMILIFTMGNDTMFDGATFNAITRTDGFSLMALFAIFLFYTFGIAKLGGSEEKVKEYKTALSVVFTLGGLAALVIGGKLVVDNAVILARLAGLSEALIGLTIVAVGTSLPELFTSVVATYHGHDDMAIGNVVGSNIFNVFWILGLTSVILQLPFNSLINTDVLVGIGASLVLFLALFIGRKHSLDRWQGAIFVIAYFAYITYLIMRG